MYERMLDQQAVPTLEEMESYCGSCSSLFQKLNGYLIKTLGTQMEIRFPYGNKYGWSATHRIKRKLLCDIFAEAGSFTVMVRLSNRQYEAEYDALLEYTRDYIDRKYPCGDGGWIHYRVLCEEHLQDIQRLLSLKAKKT